MLGFGKMTFPPGPSPLQKNSSKIPEKKPTPPFFLPKFSTFFLTMLFVPHYQALTRLKALSTTFNFFSTGFVTH